MKLKPKPQPIPHWMSLIAGAGALLASVAVAIPVLSSASGARALAGSNDFRTATAVRRQFTAEVRRTGTLRPINEERINSKVEGVIQEMAPQGSIVKKGDVIFKIDPTPHQDALIKQEAQIVENKAAFAQTLQDSLKILNKAREDVAGYDLRLELEQMRLDELKRGPDETEILNTETALQNAHALLDARIDELTIIEELSKLGFASKEELRQKQLQVTEQKLQVEQAEIKNRKIRIIDPVKVAEQDLKLKDASKTRDVARARVTLLERNIEREKDRYNRRLERDIERQKLLEKRVENCVLTATAPGLIVHKRSRWYTFAPGRQVYEGQYVMSLPDFSRMKVELTVDEARIGLVSKGLRAKVRPAGWAGAPFEGTVTRVADKGHDEFEAFQDETTDIVGSANRQVFDVEIEIDGESPVLRMGLRVDVSIVIATLESSLVVPRTALRRAPDDSVYVLAGSNADKKPVKVLAENDLEAAIEGVAEGETVWIVDPQ
jgi:HlyD family secretion protein